MSIEGDQNSTLYYCKNFVYMRL